MSCCEHSLNTMRYADRVKELGAADPVVGGLDEQLPMRDDGVLIQEGSDLAQLRSLNDGELSADWYNFQEAISHLQQLEEEVVESHKTTILEMQQWTTDGTTDGLSLLNTTNEMAY